MSLTSPLCYAWCYLTLKLISYTPATVMSMKQLFSCPNSVSLHMYLLHSSLFGNLETCCTANHRFCLICHLLVSTVSG